MTPSSAHSPAMALQSAVRHHQEGRLAEAEQLYKQVLKAQPENSDALHLLGVIAHQRGQYETAVKTIQQAIALRPDAAEYHNNCGEAFRAMGRLEAAVECYQKAVALNPGYAMAHHNMGLACQMLGRRENAAACFENAVRANPAFTSAYFELGNALQQLGRLDSAIMRYQKALELKPDFPEALNNMGNALQAQDKLDPAIACYARALKLRPDYVMAINNLGNVCLAQGRLEAAVARYEKVVELKPDFAEAWYNLGNVYHELGQTEQAAKNYAKAISLKPDYAEAHHNLGIMYRAQGRLSEALECFQKALAGSPGYLQAHTILAVTLQELGKTEEAIATYRSILGIPPDYALRLDKAPAMESGPAGPSAEGAQASAIMIATSIAPKNIENQRKAVESWLQQGFKVASVNSREETSLIEPDFRDIEFIVTSRDARHGFGKPYVYFDDVLAAFRDSDCRICGIVNSDIHLLQPRFKEFIRKEASNAFVFGSRVEISSLDTREGEFYHKGYDYFFFDRKFLDIYPREDFCLGLPWWDYWAVLIPILAGVPVKKLTTRAGYHVSHPINWNDNYWATFGLVIARYIGAAKPPSREYLNIYDKYVWTLIESRSQAVEMPEDAA